jgi:hypothetical protein
LVICTTNNPATPKEWAKALVSYIVRNRLITLKGEAHTNYGRGSARIDDDVDYYLIQEKFQSQNISCG